MKTTHLITICSILLLSSQTYSQESVAGGGMGGSDFGNVNLDVPEEGQQDEAQPKNSDQTQDASSDTTNDSVEAPSGTPTADGGGGGYISTENVTWQVSTPVLSILQFIDIISYTGDDSNSGLQVTEWKIRGEQRPKVDPVEKFRNRINKQGKVNSGTRVLLTNKGRDGSSCNSRPRQDTVDNTARIPKQCSCCCHEKPSGGPYLTETAAIWDDGQSSSAYGQHDVGKDGNPAESHDDQGGSSLKDDDDCDCNCKCGYPIGIAFYD